MSIAKTKQHVRYMSNKRDRFFLPIATRSLLIRRSRFTSWIAIFCIPRINLLEHLMFHTALHVISASSEAVVHVRIRRDDVGAPTRDRGLALLVVVVTRGATRDREVDRVEEAIRGADPGE